MRYFVTAALLLLVFSCKGKRDVPPGILKPDKMQEVFWDFVSADVYTSDHLRHDSTKNLTAENLKMQQSIFRQHHITKEEFYKSYTYYSNHKDLMTMMIDSMVAKKRREKTPGSKPE